MLDVTSLTSGYGQAQALFDISLSVERGDALALLGRNGVGKSTTMKALMGLLPIWSGAVTFNGQDIAGWSADNIARAGIGYVPEDRRVFANLSVDENLIAGQKPGPDGAAAWTAERAYDLFPEIARRRRSPAGTLSGGERQILSIARALMGNPLLLLLDEPSEGLAPVVVERLSVALSSLLEGGLTLLIAEQNRFLAEAVAQRVIVLEGGVIRYDGTFADLSDDAEMEEKLLGLA